METLRPRPANEVAKGYIERGYHLNEAMEKDENKRIWHINWMKTGKILVHHQEIQKDRLWPNKIMNTFIEVDETLHNSKALSAKKDTVR